ncbi:MAG TPA: ABC transporter ATP-binding protein [Acidimicrobiales bacterium]|nr:ABC transporter ATP-binding protein [Acidimicrobiales bacterium]
MSPGTETTLKTVALSKSYGGNVAIEPLDISVAAGQVVALVGRNGSGKTTLIKMAAGLLEPTSGMLTVQGEATGSLAARALVSYLPDEPVLYDDLSVMEHIEVTCRLHGCERWEESAATLLEVLGLCGRANDLPSRFSRGMRQKTSVLLGLVRPFALLLVDEPFVGLDPGGRAAFVKLIKEAAWRGASVVVATHELDYAATADRCVALRDGVVVYDGAPAMEDLQGLDELR